jgi:5-methylcytosine-specific restriction enzyme A
MEQNQRRYFKMPEDKKEFLIVYTTEHEDKYLIDCITLIEVAEAKSILLKENEQNYEASINYPIFDPTASLETVKQLTKIRKLNRAIGDNLKMLYNYRCQICGDDFGQRFDAHIVESHHIDPFVISMNNDASNQIIICPNHHRVIHKAKPAFHRDKLMLVFNNGVEERLVYNKHL